MCTSPLAIATPTERDTGGSPIVTPCRMLTLDGCTTTGLPVSSSASMKNVLPRRGMSSAPMAKPPSSSTSTHALAHAGMTAPGCFDCVARTSLTRFKSGAANGSTTLPTTNGSKSVDTGGALRLSCFVDDFDGDDDDDAADDDAAADDDDGAPD